ncbi:MAG: phosphate-starvation-inducible PsiE family protein, partial [Thiobacillaceae bacterium]|nr:phosphate-starvation-inducible PsiE family protein [Thiobacillaceae bacterium]
MDLIPSSKIALTLLHVIEQLGLLVIVVATIVAGVHEVGVMIDAGTVTLADLLLMFLYLEILAMVGVYYRSGKLPVR